MTTKWEKFKHNTWPNFYWKWLGIGLVDDLYSYWWLNVKKEEHYWLDASQDGCKSRWCRHCGKGKIK